MRKTNKTSFHKASSLFVLMLGLIFFLAQACNQGPPKNSKTAQVDRGKTHFMNHCTECHGEDGKGVKIDSMDVQPLDLTTITSRWGVAEFPVQAVAKKIDGRQFVSAHGQRDMPIWGDIFTKQEKLDEKQLRGKLGELIAYLSSLQGT